MDISYVTYSDVSPFALEMLPIPDCSQGCDFYDDWHTCLGYSLCYAWLAQRAGFAPLFVAVGGSLDALYITGYPYQFSRRRYGTPPVYHPREEVLFSFRNLEEVVFSDYDAWHIVLNNVNQDFILRSIPYGHKGFYLKDTTPYEEKLILKPSYSRASWLRLAKKRPGLVQGVVSHLDARMADRITVRSLKSKRRLVGMGFNQDVIQVARLRADLEA